MKIPYNSCKFVEFVDNDSSPIPTFFKLFLPKSNFFRQKHPQNA